MNKVILDIGNSALKWAFLYGNGEPKTLMHQSEVSISSDLFREWDQYRIDYVYGTAVARPQLKDQVQRFVRSKGGACKWFLSERVFEGDFRLVNTYKDPKKLGADRWYGAIGAIDYLRDSSIVLVQLGTATTVDLIRKLGRDEYVYEGGCILPGLSLMYSALQNKIPSLTGATGNFSLLPKDTSDAIKSGIVLAQLGPVQTMLKELEKKSNYDPCVLMTGGNASEIMKDAGNYLGKCTVVHNLVLNGIKLRVKHGVRLNRSL